MGRPSRLAQVARDPQTDFIISHQFKMDSRHSIHFLFLVIERQFHRCPVSQPKKDLKNKMGISTQTAISWEARPQHKKERKNSSRPLTNTIVELFNLKFVR